MKKVFKHRTGAILIEEILSLTICLFSLVLSMSLVSAIQHNHKNYILEYHDFLYTIESNYYKFEVISCDKKHVILYNANNDKEYHLEKYKNMLRLTGKSLGHIRVLSNVGDVSWSYRHNKLYTKVIFDDKTSYDSVSWFKNKS